MAQSLTGPTTLGPTGSLKHNAVVLIAKFLMENQELGVMRTVSETVQLAPHQGDTMRMTTYRRFKAQRLNDVGMDVTTAQALTDEEFEISSTGAAVKAEIPEIYARRAADPSIFEKAGQLINMALKVLQDMDGCDQMAVYPQLGTTGANLTPGLVDSAGTLLMTGGQLRTVTDNQVEPSDQEMVGVFHPNSLSILSGRLAPLSTAPQGAAAYDGTNGNSVTLGMDAEGRKLVAKGQKALGEVGGVRLFRNGNILVNADNSAVGAVYSRPTLKYMNEVESSIKRTTDESAIKQELFAYYYGGWGVYKPTIKGRAIRAAAAFPTG